jgi:2,4-didehydro-3-deoxy-L-rhamnonate hydrolase
MKLVRYGAAGAEQPGLIDRSGALRSLVGIVTDIDADAISPVGLSKLRAIDTESLPLVSGNVRYGVPIGGVRKFIAIGLNYRDHAAEADMAIPAEPIIFQKAISSLCGANDDVIQPPGAEKLDWEVELGIVIGVRASHVASATALDHVAGYLIVHDVSERAYQLERGGSWDKGKSYDSFGPVGPWLVTADEIADVHALDLKLHVNGVQMQSGNTRNFIFDVPAIIACVSQYMTLEPGDIIATGTPAGVGMGKKPDPVFLAVGDQVDLSITGLGTQRQTVVRREFA